MGLKVKDAAELLEGVLMGGVEAVAEVEVHAGYASDLLSDVMANALEGSVWVTCQTHSNIVAVATLVGIPLIVVAGGLTPEAETVARAEEKGVALVTTRLSAFEAVGRLYSRGVRGATRRDA